MQYRILAWILAWVGRVGGGVCVAGGGGVAVKDTRGNIWQNLNTDHRVDNSIELM